MKDYEVPCWFAIAGLYCIGTSPTLTSPQAVAGVLSLGIVGVGAILKYLEVGSHGG